MLIAASIGSFRVTLFVARRGDAATVRLGAGSLAVRSTNPRRHDPVTEALCRSAAGRSVIGAGDVGELGGRFAWGEMWRGAFRLGGRRPP